MTDILTGAKTFYNLIGFHSLCYYPSTLPQTSWWLQIFLTNFRDSNFLNLKKPRNTGSATNWAKIISQFSFSRPIGSGWTLAWKTRGSQDNFTCKQSPLSLPSKNTRHLRGKLYLKQVCAAIIHSALVSQKMAIVLFGFSPKAASPLPKLFTLWFTSR